MKKVIFLVIALLLVAYVGFAQSIVPDDVVQVGENAYSDALGWQDYQGSSTLLYMPLGGAMATFGTYSIIQFFTSTAAIKPVPKLVVGITCILAAGLAVSYSAATSNTW